MSFAGLPGYEMSGEAHFGDSENLQCDIPNCIFCNFRPIVISPNTTSSESPISKKYLANSSNNESDTTNVSHYPNSFVPRTIDQNYSWDLNQQAASSSSSSMTSVPKTRRRARVPTRTLSPVAIIDLTTDTPTPPPSRSTPRTQVSHEQNIGIPPFNIVSDDSDDDFNFSTPYQSYPSFSNDENLGGIFGDTVSTTITVDNDFSSFFDQPRLNIGQQEIPRKEQNPDPVPTINDSVESEAVALSCPICFEDLRPTRKPTSTKCGHVFCEECLNTTLVVHKKCPKCNAPITRKSCIRLFL